MEQEKNRKLVDLPYDIWMEIIPRIPMRSIHQVSCVCTDLYKMITHHFSANLLNVYPSVPTNLVIPANKSCFSGNLLISQFLPNRNLIMAEIYVTRDYPQARTNIDVERHDLGCEYEPVASCNGLVLLISSYVVNLDPFRPKGILPKNIRPYPCCVSNSTAYQRVNSIVYCVTNPILRQYMELPYPISSKGRRYFCGFGFCPSSKQYKVIQFHYQEGKSTVVEVHTLNSYTWRNIQSIPIESLENHVRTGRSIGTYLNGFLYWMVFEGENGMYSFDLENEKFSYIVVQEFDAREGEKYFGTTGGHLYVSVHLNGVLEVFLPKGSDFTWTKVLSLRIPLPRETGPIEVLKYSDETDTILILGYSVNEDIEDFAGPNFFLMAWNPKDNKKNRYKNKRVQYIDSGYRPVTYVPNFTSISDTVARGRNLIIRPGLNTFPRRIPW